MKKVKIGYLPLYIKLYDDSDASMRDPMVEYMHTLVSMLESQGLEVVCADVCRIKPEFEAAAKLFNDNDVDAVVTQHLAYSPSLESIDAIMSIKAQLIIMDTTPAYDLIACAGYRNEINNNHGIHGVQEFCNMLRQRGRSYELCVGHAMHSEVVSEVAGLCRAAKVKKSLCTSRVGRVGGEFHGMGDFRILPEAFKARIGAEVFEMTDEETKAYLAQVTDEEIEAEIKKDAESFNVALTDFAAYREAVRSGLAVRKWVEAKNLNACTVNFLSLDQYGLPKMPFVECCRMMERNLGYAGEGDVLTAAFVGALLDVYPDTTFTEMFCPDWNKDVVLLSHMGEFNPKLAQWKPHLNTTPFNYNACGDTAAAYGCFRPGKAVFVNLAPMGDHFALIASKVEMLGCGLEDGAYADSVQGWMKPATSLPTFLKNFSMKGGTHHSALIYNANIEEILAFGRMMGFETSEI